MTKSYIDPDNIGNVDEIPYKWLVFRFVGRQRRLKRLEELKCPKQVIEGEQNNIQKAYNQMREKCLKDPEFLKGWKE